MITKPRRGMLLLIVLALLAMFAMIAVAFVVMTGANKRSADQGHTIEAVLDPPAKTLDQAFDVAARGSNSPQSAIKSWGLLEKIYGSILYNGQIGNGDMAPVLSGSQLLTLNVPDPMHKVGCTITMLTGEAAGLTSRIVGLAPVQAGSIPTVAHVAAFPGNVVPKAPDSYIINGFPYSGTGFGYNSSSGLLNATDSNNEMLALLPNNPVNWNPPGGSNCDYTAPDFQDPLLAFAQTNSSGSTFVPIPSLHRADLIAYWGKTKNISGDLTLQKTWSGWAGSPQTAKAAFLRQIWFRPSPVDHPVFCASVNPNFNPVWDGVSQSPSGGVTWQWDVDNDGDGVPDSVWVDLGFPVRFTTDGRAYKPLFAILCLDLDGRLNVNAHSTLAQSQSGYYQNISMPYAGSLPLDSPLTLPTGKFAGKAPNWPASTQLPRGQGYGPAEVNLAPLFTSTPGAFDNPFNAVGSFNLQDFGYLFGGNSNSGQLGRCGEAIQPAQTARHGMEGQFSPLSWNRWFPYGESYWQISNGTTSAVQDEDAYGSPPDTQGIGAIGLDLAGRPLHFSMGSSSRNSPYDLDLSHDAPHASGGTTTADSPFSVGELEAILRPFDRDSASLPPRLAELGGNTLVRYHRADLTTESFSVPSAPSLLPLSLSHGTLTHHPVDLIASSGSLNLALAASLLPWETQQGLKMDINRPFGGGARSKNGKMSPGLPGAQYVETDQPGLQSESFAQYLNSASGTQSIAFSYNCSGGTGDSLTARQLYAQHLYVLMMLNADLTALDAQTGSRENTARSIAQWAVNCVAFRDHNSIMIPFNYDVNPFTNAGWNPDGTLAHTVWGCKRPDLIISETLAFHDRRTEDLNTEVPDPKNQPGAKNGNYTQIKDPKSKTPDPNFDQNFRPKGSLFVELLNPWTSLESQSRDLLLGAPANTSNGVLLTQTTSQGGSGSPVWRMIIIDPSKNPPVNGVMPDPDAPNPATPLVIERVVYFVPRTTVTIPSDPSIPANAAVYTPSGTLANPVIPPGGYAVIGSGETAGPNTKQTLIGLDGTKNISGRNGRYITLSETDVKQNSFVVRNNTTWPSPPLAGFVPAAPVVLAIDTPQRLSVSEPVAGYTQYEKTPKGPVIYNPVTETYSQTIDIPLDQQRNLNEPGISSILDNDGTYPAFRIIYLQRLADPTRPYAAVTPGNINKSNPYRTIDSMPVDLTTFNGVSTDKDPNNIPSRATPVRFEARQRGTNNALPGEINLWKQEPLAKTTWTIPPPQTVTNQIFPAGLVASLGYLNDPFYKPVVASPSPVTNGPYQGNPPAPFPWFNWAYRPFVNEYELLQVPAVSSSQLLINNGNPNQRMGYGYVDLGVRSQGINAYSQPNFPHLLNLFSSGPASSSGTATGATPQFHRVLAYVGVRSPYVNMETQGRADLFAAGTGNHWFHPPYNGISAYREPGRINLNTIASSDVFLGLANFHPAFSQSNAWSKFWRSRRGPNSTADLTIDPSMPSRFMQPFRTPGGASLSLLYGSGGSEPREADYTLLRSDPDVPTRPLFQVDDTVMKTGNSAGTPDQFTNAPYDYNRSSYFRYQAIQRLAGAVTCHSNVFATWITVGYFEVTRAPNPNLRDPNGNLVYPDGYQLGQELGSDTGDIVRHRAFYIFDRSIPVGFVRGQDINQDKATLLKRYIE